MSTVLKWEILQPSGENVHHQAIAFQMDKHPCLSREPGLVVSPQCVGKGHEPTWTPGVLSSAELSCAPMARRALSFTLPLTLGCTQCAEVRQKRGCTNTAPHLWVPIELRREKT